MSSPESGAFFEGLFSKYRKIFFPIHKSEYVKFFSLLGIFIFISFVYNLLHNLKDIFFLKSTGKAEILPFIKIYFVAPSMLLMIYTYVKLSKSTNPYTRFNFVIVYFFLVISLLYGVFLPNLESFKLDKLADFLSVHFSGMKYLWEALRYWPITLLYIHGEAWSSIVLSVSFWGLANEIVSFEEAGRIYSFLTSIGSAIGSITAGFILKSDFLKKNFNNGIGIVCLSIIIMMIIFNSVKNNLKRHTLIKTPSFERRKEKKNIIASFKTLFKSKHLFLIFLIVVSYNLFIHFFEAIWKNQVTIFSQKEGSHFLAIIFGNQSILIGVFVLIFGFFAPLIKKKGWKITALVTPLVGIIASTIFCFFLYKGNFILSFFDIENISSKVVYFSVLIGLLNIVIIKSSKYVLFDSTKEQAYIPLSASEKLEGKSAIDGVCSRFGKSLGGVILSAPYIGLIHVFGSISMATPFISVLMIFILLLWIKSIGSLSISIKKLKNKK